MISVEDKTKCCGCRACEQICPMNAIRMAEDVEGFLYPEVNKEKCVACGRCDSACPVLGAGGPDNEVRLAYAVRTKDADVLQSSTSGGIAFELARYTIDSGGRAFGACFGENQKVVHRSLSTIEELRQSQGSKYVQSDILDTFRKTGDDLKKGKVVYFTGTPCQIEGLHSYLGRDWPNLITQDLICHGVPSPGLWRKYLKEKKWETADSIVFRDKQRGWETKSDFVVSVDGRKFRTPFHLNPFSYFFGQNYSLRPICFQCPFKTGHKKSDFTVADLWGISELIPKEQNDDRGWSLLLIHTEKGRRYFEKLEDRVDAIQIDYDKAVANNMMMLRSVTENGQEKRARFFEEIQYTSFDKLYRKYRPKDPPILAIKKKLYPIKRALLEWR